MLAQLLNGLQYSMLLFMLAVGLSVVFGLMNFVNLAHGTIYMIAAFCGLSAARSTGSFLFALVVGPAVAAALGAIFYATLLKRLQGQSPMKQVLVTFGLIFIGLDIVRMLWGDTPQSLPVPPVLEGSLEILGHVYPVYRMFIIVVGIAVFVSLWLLIESTRLGAVVRAGVDDKDMTAALGINVDLAFFVVFCLGCALAGLAGVVAAPLLQIYRGMDMAIIIPTLIVVVIGGPGRLFGAFGGSLLVGMSETLGAVFYPAFASFVIYLILALVLLVRPRGLFSVRGH